MAFAPHLREDLERFEALIEHRPLWQRVSAITIACLVHGTVYFGANHFPSREPRLLQLTAFDHWVPFIPLTAIIYMSAVPLSLVAFMTLKRVIDMRHFLEVFVVTVLVAGVVHWAVPTTYPRELFPLDTAAHPTGWLLELVRRVDTPSSCFPSLHVGLAFSGALALRQVHRRGWWAFLAWAVAIAISTLTTKQHYAADIVGGLVLAFVAVGLVERLNRRFETLASIRKAESRAPELANAAPADTSSS